MTATALDAARLAVLNARMEAVVRRMANALLRTGRSGVLAIARDFSCCITGATGDLVTANEALPIHVLSGPELMVRAMIALHPDFAPGDLFLNNSPYHGCSHAADHTLLQPVFDAGGVHRATLLVKAHQADIGNALPTTYFADAQDVYAEGALIFPCVKVGDAGGISRDFERMCRMRIRAPDQWWGDFLAMLGAIRTGAAALVTLADEIGWDMLTAFERDWLDYSERRMASALARLPAGAGTATSRHDPFPGTPADGVPVTAHVSVDPAAGLIAIDLRDNPDCMNNGLNLSESCARTAAMVGVFNAIGFDVPRNAGSFRRIDVALRENCCVGIPQHPVSTSLATTNLASRVGNAVQVAIAGIADGFGMAECGGAQCAADSVIASLPGDPAPFVNQIFLGSTAGAAHPATDAWLTIGDLGNAGMCSLDSIELDELRQPIHVFERRLLADTEGAGFRRGAPSVRVAFGGRTRALSASYASDGTIYAAAGVRGGLSGAPAGQQLVSRDGTVTDLPASAQVVLVPGDRIVSTSAAGGGYGAPDTREPDRVAADVAEGWITRDRARQVYRVAIGDDRAVDAERTAALRSS